MRELLAQMGSIGRVQLAKHREHQQLQSPHAFEQVAFLIFGQHFRTLHGCQQHHESGARRPRQWPRSGGP